MTPRIMSVRGDLPTGRAFRLAVADRSLALWCAPIERDGRTFGGDDHLIVVSQPRNLADAEDLLAVVRSVTTP